MNGKTYTVSHGIPKTDTSQTIGSPLWIGPLLPSSGDANQHHREEANSSRVCINLRTLKFWVSMVVVGAMVCLGGLYEGLENGTGSALALGGFIWALSSLGKLKDARTPWSNPD